jgi:hypothetical protein
MGWEAAREVESGALHFSKGGKQEEVLSQNSGVIFCEMLAGSGRDDTICERPQLDRVKGGGGEEEGRRPRNCDGEGR